VDSTDQQAAIRAMRPPRAKSLPQVRLHLMLNRVCFPPLFGPGLPSQIK
jgi:hypothetical protein